MQLCRGLRPAVTADAPQLAVLQNDGVTRRAPALDVRAPRRRRRHLPDRSVADVHVRDVAPERGPVIVDERAHRGPPFRVVAGDRHVVAGVVPDGVTGDVHLVPLGNPSGRHVWQRLHASDLAHVPSSGAVAGGVDGPDRHTPGGTGRGGGPPTVFVTSWRASWVRRARSTRARSESAASRYATSAR